MIMENSLYTLLMTEDCLVKDICRYKDAIEISDSEYHNDMARYDRLINSAEYGRDTSENDLKKVRLQIREYIKMLMSLDEKGDAQ